jgi:sec-independent protein translocase protein TatC
MGATLAASAGRANERSLPVLAGHIKELNVRLFWIAVIFIVAALAAFPLKDIIAGVLIHPIGGQLPHLVKVGIPATVISVYVGLLAVVPALVYHMHRYLRTVVGLKEKPATSHLLHSTLLAIAGVVFAYAIGLPAAFFFLTGFGGQPITATLTVDAYLSFVTAYTFGAAALFQMPLILQIINKIAPLQPDRLRYYQRYVILGAFVIAAVVSPTPDVFNQALLAAPAIIMYQLSVYLVRLGNQQDESQTNLQPVEVTATTSQNDTVKEAGVVNDAPEAINAAEPAAAARPQLPSAAPKAAQLHEPAYRNPVSRVNQRMEFVSVQNLTPPKPINQPKAVNTPQMPANNVAPRQLPRIERPAPSISSVRSIDGLMPRQPLRSA